jgi:hypothetical protein
MEAPPRLDAFDSGTCAALHPSQHVFCRLPRGHAGEHCVLIRFTWPAQDVEERWSPPR